MMYYRLFFLVPLGLAACDAPPPEGPVIPPPGSYSEAPPDPGCIVTSVRHVQLIGGGQTGGSVGTISGTREDEAGVDADVAGVIGGTSSAAPSRAPRGSGLGSVEYTVREGSSRQVIVQDIDASGAVLSAGTACQVVGTGASRRVVWG